MKTKIIFLVTLLTIMTHSSFSQFVITGPASASNLWSGGAAGIGYTTVPAFGTNKFLVNGNSLFTGNSQTTGFTGLGNVSNGLYRLSVTGNSLFSGAITVGNVPTTGVATSLTVSATANDSGLRLATLPNTATVSTNNNGRFLGVDAFGKVLLVAAASSWNTTGNAGTLAATNFIGTTDDVDLVFRRNAIKSGLISATNTFFGVNAGLIVSEDAANQIGTSNTFVGSNSGLNLISGRGNSFFGRNSGLSSTGNASTYLGANSGSFCAGSANTFVGSDTGSTAPPQGDPFPAGDFSTFIGHDSGGSGNANVFVGSYSGKNSKGSNNVFVGAFIGEGVTGSGNTLLGSNMTISSTLANTVVIGNGAGIQRMIIDNLGATTLTGLAGTNTGKVLTADNSGKLQLVANTGGATIYIANGALTANRTVNLASNNLIFTNGTSTTNGKIYIGDQTPLLPTTTGNYKLYVEGGILTEKVRVALRNDPTFWADYVFANDYKLAPLAEVEKYYTANKHLPNVPSSLELLQSGLDLAVMQAKQMEKIEELTLYIVAQNKAIEALKVQVEALLINSK